MTRVFASHAAWAVAVYAPGCLLLERADALSTGSVRGVATFGGDGVDGVAVSPVGAQISARTRGGGTFVLGGLPVGDLTPRLAEDSDTDGVVDRGAAVRFRVRALADGSAAGVDLGDIPLVRAVRVAGTVVAEDGGSLDDVIVALARPDIDATAETRTAVDPNGAFVLSGVVPGTVTVCAFGSGGRASAPRTLTVAGDEDVDGIVLTLRVTDRAWVTATVLPPLDGAHYGIVPAGQELAAPIAIESVGVFTQVDAGLYDVVLKDEKESVIGFLPDQVALPGTETRFGPVLLGLCGICGEGEGEGEGEGKGEGEAPNAPPVVASTVVRLRAGAADSFQLAVSDPDGDAVRVLAARGFPAFGVGSVDTDGTLSCSPSQARGGFFSLEIDITDGSDTVTATLPVQIGDKVFLGGDPTSDASWDPAGVPGPADVALFPAAAGDAVVDSAALVSLRGLHAEDGVALDFQFASVVVIGDVDARAVSGSATLSVCTDSPEPAACRVDARGFAVPLSIGAATIATLTEDVLVTLTDAATVEGPINANGGVTIASTGDVSVVDGAHVFRGPVLIEGTLTANEGALHVTGDVTLEGPLTVVAPGGVSIGVRSEAGATVTLGRAALSEARFGALVVVSDWTLAVSPSSVSVNVDGVTIEPGAALTGNDLRLVTTDAIDIRGTLTGVQQTEASGGTFTGPLPRTPLVVTGDVHLSGAVKARSFVEVAAGGTLFVDDADVVIDTALFLDAGGTLRFGGTGTLTAPSLTVNGVLDLAGSGALRLTGSAATFDLASGGTIVRGPTPRGYRVVFADPTGAELRSSGGAPVVLEDIEVLDGCFLDVSNGGGGLAPAVEDVVVGAGAGIFTNTSTVTVEGTCGGTGTPPTFCP